MTFIMHSSRFPNYWLGRMDCDRNDTSLTATITDAVQNLIWNINLAESYIYIVIWKLILSLTNSYIYNFLMFLAYLTALCQRRDQISQSNQPFHIRGNVNNFYTLIDPFSVLHHHCHIIYLLTKLFDLGNYLLNHICCFM